MESKEELIDDERVDIKGGSHYLQFVQDLNELSELAKDLIHNTEQEEDLEEIYLPNEQALVNNRKVFIQKHINDNSLIEVHEEMFVLRDGEFVPLFTSLDIELDSNKIDSSDDINGIGRKADKSAVITETQSGCEAGDAENPVKVSGNWSKLKYTECSPAVSYNELNCELQYNCNMCHMSFPLPELVNVHKNEFHISEATIKCVYCETVFASREEENAHILEENAKCLENKESPSHAASKREHSRQHLNRLLVRPLHCYLCHLVYQKQSLFNEHMTHAHSIKHRYYCKKCKFSSSSPDFLQGHFIKVHGSKYSKKIRHVCEKCRKTFSSLHSLQTHMRVHNGEKPFVCNTCGRSFSSREVLAYHKTIHRPRETACEVCGALFPNKHQLRSHQRKHSDYRRYQCTLCGHRFKGLTTLKGHFLRIHSNKRPYECNVCGRRFPLLGVLNTHKKSHSNLKPITCETCGKAFKDKTHLRVHLRIHTGEKPYYCYLCQRRFSQMTGLKCHAKTHGDSYDMEEHRRIYRSKSVQSPAIIFDASSCNFDEMSYLTN